MFRTLEDELASGLNHQIDFKIITHKKHWSYPNLMNCWRKMFSFSEHTAEYNTGAQKKQKR